MALVTPSASVAAIATSSASSSPTNTGLNPADEVFATAGNAQGTMDTGSAGIALGQAPVASDPSLDARQLDVNGESFVLGGFDEDDSQIVRPVHCFGSVK